MKKIIYFLVLIFLATSVYAVIPHFYANLDTILNPFTQKQQYITSLNQSGKRLIIDNITIRTNFTLPAGTACSTICTESGVSSGSWDTNITASNTLTDNKINNNMTGVLRNHTVSNFSRTTIQDFLNVTNGNIYITGDLIALGG